MAKKSDPTASGQLQSTDIFSGLFSSLTHDNLSKVDGFVENASQNIQMVNKTLGMLNNDFNQVFEDLLNTIQEKICDLTSSDRTSIFLLDKVRQQLWLMVDGPNNTKVEIRIPFDPSTIAGEVATSQKTINIPFDFFDDPRSGFAKKHFQQTGYRTYSMLSLPLLGEKGELVAVVELINKVKNNDKNEQLKNRIDKVGFTHADMKMFSKFSVLIGQIIESSNSFYQAAQKQRIADALIKAVLSVNSSHIFRQYDTLSLKDERYRYNTQKYLEDRISTSVTYQKKLSDGTTWKSGIMFHQIFFDYNVETAPRRSLSDVTQQINNRKNNSRQAAEKNE